MTNNKEMLGGVSPIKARQSSRGGKHAGKATATSGRRGGFAKSTGKRGGGGRNVGGYNVQTRFRADKWTPPKSGGTMTYPTGKPKEEAPAPQKPYTYTPEGEMVITPSVDANANANATATTSTTTETTDPTGYYEDIYEDRTTTTGGLESYKSVWNRNKDNIQGRFSSYDDFVKEADRWWDEEASEEQKQKRNKTTKTERVKVGERWVETSPGSSKTTTTSSSASDASAAASAKTKKKDDDED